MPNKEMPKKSSQPGKMKPSSVHRATEADAGLAGRESLGKDSQESDFEITGRESLVSKKEDKNRPARR
ncbi:hypothetical protein [Bdellovibrio svalbardensis]|uniref:Uncharacterized protein n=1 Tax=Bdellovibrio svalbardensis TaxID=2972972 RepID=A0ABT6DGM5_9BACT|nr:hypothetical protein [Bdellovibrio svalbardensis]MDG0815976.1 hypothetical protein [Bdellovibrio svalbardensis]